MSPSTATDPMVARFWTRARRFPRLIGKTVNGDRIPGGPYTTAQAIGGFLTVWLLWESRPIWGQGNIVAELVFIAAAGWGVVWTLGKVPLNSRNPLILAAGFVHAVFSPRRGRSAGRGVADRDFGAGYRPMFGTRPAPVWNGRLPGAPFGPDDETELARPRTAATVLAPPPMAPPFARAAAPSSSEPSDPALTGLQRLLADAARTPDGAATTDTGDAGDDWVHVGRRVNSALTGEDR